MKDLSEANADSNSKSGSGDGLTMKAGLIDPKLKLGDQAKIHKDGDTVFEVMLFQTNILLGSNKFYHMQLIDVNGTAKRFIVYRKWGRGT